jgi:type IV pilus assembly protein PilQ
MRELKILKLSMLVACLTVLSAGMNTAWAQTLEAVNFRALNQDSFEVEFQLSDSTPVDAQVFVIDTPARIVVDMAGVQNAVEQRNYALSYDNVTEAVLLSTNDRTRLIVNMNVVAQYETRQQGNRFYLSVGNSDASSAAGTPVVSSTSRSRPAQTNIASIQDLNFRRGAEGEGSLFLALSSNRVNADVQRSGGEVVIELYNTQLPERFRHTYDVVDFATPLSEFEATYDGTNTTIRMQTNEEFDYLAYQADQNYVVTIKPLTAEQESQLAREFEYTGERLSLNFQDIEVRAVLQLIADFTGLNLVASDTVEGSITLRLENVPWDQALDIVLRAKGLDSRQDGNVMLVAPIAEIAEREALQVEANRQLEELAPLRTEFIRVRYADAQTLFSLFGGDSGGGAAGGEGGGSTTSILSARGSAIVDTRTNTIILTDTDEKILAFRELINQIDIPIRQVMIEARIVIANTDFREELGIRWGGAGVRTIEDGEQALQFGGQRNILSDGGPLGFFNGQNDLDLDDTLSVDLGVAAATSNFTVAFLSDSAFVDLELSALENEGHGEIVSQPKVITGDKQTAMIRSGEEIAYQEASASGATAVAFKEAVLSLEVTPQITPDDRVILDLIVSQDSRGDIVAGGIPTIDVTSLETQVLVNNGQTLVLGGIFQMNSIAREERVPFLGSLPIVGNAFRNTVDSREKREILIFITPKILSDSLLNR